MKQFRILHGLLAIGLLTPGLVMGATILVNTTDDELNADGDCSLREAVASANDNSATDACEAGSGADIVLLVINGAMQLSMGQIEVTEALEVQGFFDDLTINAGSGSRHFFVNMPDNTHDFSVSFVTLAGGDAPDTGGGSILAEQVGTLTLESVALSNNQATDLDTISGGAVAMLLPANNGSRLEIVDSVFADNTSGSNGGAVFIAGMDGSNNVESVDIQRSRFVHNTARGSGGAISASAVGDVSIRQSVFEGNLATRILSDPEIRQSGGALDWQVNGASAPLLFIDQSTFAGNRARHSGGALTAIGGDAVVVNATFHENTTMAGGGEALFLSGGSHEVLFSTLTDNERQTISDFAIRAEDSASVQLGHSILWTRVGIGPPCRTFTGAVITSLGYNLVQDDSCAPVPTDVIGADPKLAVLGDYGDSAAGITIETRLPIPGSPAIDGGNTNCPGPSTGGSPRGSSTLVDQRGATRPEVGPARGGSALCDIGAVEYQPGSEPVNDLFADRFEATP